MGVGETEVFKVDVCLGVDFFDRLHEFVDELVVYVAADSLSAKAEIQLIVQWLFIVGTATEDDGKCVRGMNACAKSGKNEFCYGDQDATALGPCKYGLGLRCSGSSPLVFGRGGRSSGLRRLPWDCR